MILICTWFKCNPKWFNTSCICVNIAVWCKQVILFDKDGLVFPIKKAVATKVMLVWINIVLVQNTYIIIKISNSDESEILDRVSKQQKARFTIVMI